MTGHLLEAIKSIREGILSNDMSKVVKGFELLTGESIESPDSPEVVVEQSSPDSDEDDFIAGTRSESTASRSVVSSNRVNKFVDDGTIDTAEAGYDAINDDVKPVARQRTSYKKMKQKCHVCGQEEMVNPQHKRDFYKCAKCIGNR
tara:strand:- start:36 stop:473 length:438 start_codon:yes stop_codon:yes gene_type:complete